MKTAIISGVSSFIGQALATRLLDSGTEVYGLTTHGETALRQRAHMHVLELGFPDYDRLEKRLREAGLREADVFFHLAWQGYAVARDDFRVQSANISHACEAVVGAAACGCGRFVFASSFFAHLKSRDASSEAGYCSVYGSAKHAADRMCQTVAHNAGIGYIGVLFSNIFGVGDSSARAFNTLLGQLNRGESLRLTQGRNLYDWTYIDDCVDGVLAAAEWGRPGRTYYIGSGSLRPFGEAVTEMRDAVAPQAELLWGAYPDASFIDYREIDIDQLYQDTGYRPAADFQTSVRKTAAWLRQREGENT